MDCFKIIGGRPLSGTVAVSGSKNAALPIMAAAILASEPVILDNVPAVSDVATLQEVLASVGMRCDRHVDDGLRIETVDANSVQAQFPLVQRMRASFCVLGPLLARRGTAVVPLPGGCQIGPRPIDLHWRGLAALGAEIRLAGGNVVATAKRLRGARINLRGPHGSTVTGTANVLCAAALAEGCTILEGAACEPEIVDLGQFLNMSGARIAGLETDCLRIEGVRELRGGRYRVIPDRIEAATLLMAIVASRGQGTIVGARADHLTAVLQKLTSIGCDVVCRAGEQAIDISAPRRLRATSITASPYPGMPTDVQPQWTALLSTAAGQSLIQDRVFPQRFSYASELSRMGAQLKLGPGSCHVRGVPQLSPAEVTASDLRAAAALVLAGLSAEGSTTVHEIHHLDRGYARLEEKLRRLGASIERITMPNSSSVKIADWLPT